MRCYNTDGDKISSQFKNVRYIWTTPEKKSSAPRGAFLYIYEYADEKPAAGQQSFVTVARRPGYTYAAVQAVESSLLMRRSSSDIMTRVKRENRNGRYTQSRGRANLHETRGASI